MADIWTPVSGKSDGTAVALENTILYKDTPAAAGSAMLEGFLAPFDAAVAEKLHAAGYRIAGLTQAEPFALCPVEPDLPDTPSHTLSALQKGMCEAALANDISGKLRRQSALSGEWYLHPGYGTVSRYGLIPTVSSMDQIGVLAKTFSQCFAILETIAGYDARDGVTLPAEKYRFLHTQTPAFVLPQEAWAAVPAQKAQAEALLSGQTIHSVSLPLFSVLPAVLFLLSSAEFSNNSNRYDGVKFGYRAADVTGVNDLYLRSRTLGLEKIAKLYAVMGAYALSQGQYERYYEKAMRIRGLLQKSLPLQSGSVMVLPCALPNETPFVQSALYAVASLCGLPCLSCPVGGGLQLVAAAGDENALLTAASFLEKRGNRT